MDKYYSSNAYWSSHLNNKTSYNTGRALFMWFLFVWFHCNMPWKFTPLFQTYMIIFSLTCFGIEDMQYFFNLMWFGKDDPWPYLCWRLARSDVTVTPSVMHMDWLCWWYKHAAHVNPLSPSLTLVWKTVRNMQCNASEKLAKDNQYWRQIISNKPPWKRWTNCWHMP
jgi:hypothetical protein